MGTQSTWDRQLAFDFVRLNFRLQKSKKMKMLVSLIAVCLMVAVEGSFSTHNHMEYYPPGCPMNGRHSETHVMHRDNKYNGPFSPSYNGFYNDGSHFYGSYNVAPYYGFQSYMGSDYSPFSSRFERMMPNMYSAGCPLKMNSMNRNFVNQFYRNSGSYMSGCPLEMNSMYGNFDNQFNRFPGSYMSSFGQY